MDIKEIIVIIVCTCVMYFVIKCGLKLLTKIALLGVSLAVVIYVLGYIRI